MGSETKQDKEMETYGNFGSFKMKAVGSRKLHKQSLL